MRRLSAFRNSCLVALLILLSVQSGTIAAPPSDGSNSTITSDEEWSSDGVFNGSVVIASGATLTVSANMTIVEGSSITVSQGGTLDIDSGSMHGESNDTWLSMIRDEASIEVPLQGIGGEITIRLFFTAELTEGTLKAGFTGSELQNVSGRHADFTSNVAVSTDSVQIDLQAAGFMAVKVSAITVLEGSNNDDVEDLRSLVYYNMKADGIATWNIAVSEGGILQAESTSMSGIDLNCLGDCSLNSTTMQTFEPIDLGATGTLNLDDCNLNGSITYEDVKGLLGAQINWDSDSIGTGGETDRWIIELSGQTLSAPLSGVEITLQGLGYWNTSTQVTTGSDGTATLTTRIIQWMDSSGQIESEDAKITSVLYTATANGWGTFSGQTGPLGTEDTAVSLSLPEISVISVELLEEEGNSGKSVDVKASIKNDGASANIRLSCTDSNGADVSTYPSSIPVNATSGETVEVEFTWTQFSDGKETLTCEPMIPSAFSENPDMVLGDSSSATSEELDWQEPIEANDGGVVTIIIVAISIAVAALLFMSKRVQSDKKYDVEVPEDEESTVEESEDAEEATDESED